MRFRWILVAVAAVAAAAETPFTVAQGNRGADLCVAPGESEAVMAAARDLERDIASVTGYRPKLVRERRAGCIFVGTVANKAARTALEAAGLRPAELDGKWENYVLRLARDSQLVIAGSDERGTVFGIYDFSTRYLGIDPIANWTGLPPARKAAVVLRAVDVKSGTPAFRFRGWFLNDEDLITGWQLSPERRRLVHYYFHRPIADEVYERVFETALRLRSNVIIPGSYIDLASEVDRKIVAAAVRRGLFVSQHHTQPLGVSAFAFRNYWRDRNRKLDFSYTRNPREMEEVWEHYARLWAKYPNVVWQLGLRGMADRPFWATDLNAPKTDKERGALVSSAVRKQWDIVRRVTGQAAPLGTVTLWAEGSGLHAKGHLDFPGGLAVVFADEGSSQEMQADFHNIPRQAGRNYGVYYHAAFWGAGPRLAQGVTLEKIARNYAAIAAKGDTFFSILNVGSIREVILQTEAVADLTWGGRPFEPAAFLRRWCAREFGEAAADETARLYTDFFAAYVPVSNGRLALDGVLRGQGKSLLTLALDRDTYPAYSGREALFAQLDAWEPRAGKTAQGFRAVADRARAALSRIPAARQPFFTDNLLVQAETMQGLGRWLQELCLAMRSFTAAEVGDAARHAQLAADALGYVLEYRRRAEWGPWQNWYRGDWRMNLPALHEDSCTLAQRWAGFAVLELP